MAGTPSYPHLVLDNESQRVTFRFDPDEAHREEPVQIKHIKAAIDIALDFDTQGKVLQDASGKQWPDDALWKNTGLTNGSIIKFVDMPTHSVSAELHFSSTSHVFEFSELWGKQMSLEAPTLARPTSTYVTENIKVVSDGGFFLNGVQVTVPRPPPTQRILPPSEPMASLQGLQSTPCMQTDVTVALVDTLSAALALGDNAVALNFANAFSHGGGYKRGARAQEEDLCRLLPQLIHSLEYVSYPIRQAEGECLVTRDLVAVRLVGSYELCESQGLVNMLTAAMPCGDAGAPGGKSWNATVTLRIRGVLHAAKVSGFTKLVLGAWGCGAFGNPPDLVAKLFREQLSSSEFRGAFSDIVFAIIDPRGDGNFKPFFDEIAKMHQT